MKFLESIQFAGLFAMHAVKVSADTKISVAKVAIENVCDVADLLAASVVATKALYNGASNDETLEVLVDRVSTSKIASTKRKINVAKRVLATDGAGAAPKAKALALKNNALQELRVDYNSYVQRRAHNRVSRFVVDACIGKVYSYYPKDWVKSTRATELNDRKAGVVKPTKGISIWDIVRSTLVISGSFGTVVTAIVLL